MRRRLRKLKKLLTELVRAVSHQVVAFFKGVYQHAEAVVLLVLSSIGINVLLGEIPFHFMLPMWIEAAMVIPVIAVILVLLLLKSSEFRARRRMT